ncbi:hypothetical protein ABZ946_23985 [Streptomyces sp. NPDC046324]
MPLTEAGDAVTRLRSGSPRFRIVLDTTDTEKPPAPHLGARRSPGR